MIHKSDLRHGSYYLTWDDKLIRFSTSRKTYLSYAGDYICNLSGVAFTDEIFHKVRIKLKPFFDNLSSEPNLITLYRFDYNEFYVLAIGTVKAKEIRFVHELQNVIWDLYGIEFKIKRALLLSLEP